jgi:UDP-N-acetylglucosamine transferase subunit ALG13
MIYVTVGTMFMDFPRLLLKMDEIAANAEEEVIVQSGMGKTTLPHCRQFDFKPREEALALQRDARVIICHAGIGSVLDALEVRRPFIVVPRLSKFGEHMNDHQMDLALAVEARKWGRMILDMDELPEACATPPQIPASYVPAKAPLIAAVKDLVERVAAGLPLH